MERPMVSRMREIRAAVLPVGGKASTSSKLWFRPWKSGAGIVAILAVASTSYAAFPSKGMVAHRGDCAAFPENTIPAFLSAIEKGAEMVEMDEYRCKTGELVVIHDPVVDRVAKDAKGKVADMTLDELKSLDVGVRKGEGFRGTRIPTLEEALAVFPRKGVLINQFSNCRSAYEEAARGVSSPDKSKTNKEER